MSEEKPDEPMISTADAMAFNSGQRILGDTNNIEAKPLTEDQLRLAFKYATVKSIDTSGVNGKVIIKFVFEDKSILKHILLFSEKE